MYDHVIIGGGIIGLSTAWQLKSRHPQSQVLILEKESSLARHQTGHNSGVMHAGIYYEPDSLKAEFCRAGLAATMRFCDENDIPYEQCGKLLVVESVIPPGNQPFAGKFLDFVMLLIPGGKERTEAEYRAIFEEAGFELARIVSTNTELSIVEGVQR